MSVGGAVRIREADAERDAEACRAIYAPYVTDTVVSFEERVPTLEAMADRIRAVRGTHEWLVLERDAAILGYAYAAAHRSRAAYRWAVDTTVYVGQPYVRQGVGRALYAELLDRMRKRGFHVACAGITLPNDASVGLHEAMGFRPVGVFRRIGWKAGSWHDVGWWQLELAPTGADRPPEPTAPSAERGSR